MKKFLRPLLVSIVTVALAALAIAREQAPVPIATVEIAGERAFAVNGKPFFPLFGWLQDAKNFPLLKECGMNATAGALARGAGGIAAYAAAARAAGLYGILPYDEKLKGNTAVLGYIHGDEPDLTHDESDAEVAAASALRINNGTPLWKLVDGVTSSWTALDPLQGAAVTIKLKNPVTVKSLAVHLTVSGGLALAKEIEFEADGKKILTAKLEAKKGRQAFELPAAATLRELKLTVTAVTPGQNVWGSIGEIEGLDASGKNVLAAPPRKVVRRLPERTLEEYRAIKAADPARPVFMTLTSHFMPQFAGKNEQTLKELYPQYVKGTDVVGFDVYPIYGWNKPEWIDRVYEGTKQLVELGGGRPVYAWIETSKGGQWTGALERQKDVTPTHIRAEVWMAICAGATGIGYFTHVWKPSYNQFGVPEENRKALREINGQITRLAPDILGVKPAQAVTLKAEGGVKVAAMGKENGGRLSVFCVNYDEGLKPARVTIEVAGLKAGTKVAVVDEGRTIAAEEGGFKDRFEPLAVHIYQVEK